MITAGINLIPDMPVSEVIDTIRAAEDLGYEYCLLADEGFMPDVYVALGAAARQTSSIRLGPVTNGYTRHPAVTAVALATLNELTDGRAIAVLVAGGSVVMNPMSIPLQAPLTVVRESIEIMHQLWRGEVVSWEGKRFSLDSAKMSLPAQNIPIWMAVRGPKMLALAARKADGVLLMVKPDLGPALEIVSQSESLAGTTIQRIFLEKMAYTPKMLAQAAAFFGHVVMDMPERQQRSFLSDMEIDAMKKAYAQGDPTAVTGLLTPDIIKRYKVAGTPDECSVAVRTLIHEHQLDVFLLNITGSGLEANIQLMRDTFEILKEAGKENK
jgi:5,10-methylenetetrahydromethanopterin reductase